MQSPDHLRRIRLWLTIFIVGLILSGVTAFPLQTELGWLVSLLHSSALQAIAQSTGLLPWIERVNDALRNTNAHYYAYRNNRLQQGSERVIMRQTCHMSTEMLARFATTEPYVRHLKMRFSDISFLHPQAQIQAPRMSAISCPAAHCWIS